MALPILKGEFQMINIDIKNALFLLQHNNELPVTVARYTSMTEQTAVMLGSEELDVISINKLADIDTLQMTIETYEMGLDMLRNRLNDLERQK